MASGVEGAGWPSSSILVFASLSEEGEERQLVRGRVARLWRRRDWSSPAFPGEGIMVVTTVGAVGGGS